MRYFGTLSGVLIATSVWSGGVLAAGERACESMSLFSPEEPREVYFLDLEKNDVSVGDKRIGHRILQNSNGDTVGNRVWANTVVEVGDDGKASLTTGESFNIFDDGVMYIASEFGIPRDVKATHTQSFNRDSSKFLIFGGTGAYVDAQGVLETEDTDGGMIYHIKLDCG
jgi:hypothetical protein